MISYNRRFLLTTDEVDRDVIYFSNVIPDCVIKSRMSLFGVFTSGETHFFGNVFVFEMYSWGVFLLMKHRT